MYIYIYIHTVKNKIKQNALDIVLDSALDHWILHQIWLCRIICHLLTIGTGLCPAPLSMVMLLQPGRSNSKAVWKEKKYGKTSWNGGQCLRNLRLH